MAAAASCACRLGPRRGEARAAEQTSQTPLRARGRADYINGKVAEPCLSDDAAAFPTGPKATAEELHRLR